MGGQNGLDLSGLQFVKARKTRAQGVGPDAVRITRGFSVSFCAELHERVGGPDAYQVLLSEDKRLLVLSPASKTASDAYKVAGGQPGRGSVHYVNCAAPLKRWGVEPGVYPAAVASHGKAKVIAVKLEVVRE